MYAESDPSCTTMVYTYDRRTGRLISFEPRELNPLTDREEPPPFRFEHDPAGRVFRMTADDGTVELFRDNPARYLCLEPDPETGAMRPVTRCGRPVYLYLCREEREAP